MSFHFGIQRLDEIVLQAFQALQSDPLTAVFHLVTLGGDPVFWLLVVAAVYWTGREDKGFFLANTLMFTLVATGVTKFLVARPRPSADWVHILEREGFASPAFPSGHASLVTSMSTHLQPYFRKLQWLFMALVIGVGVSRIYLGVHYLTDVLGGIVLGALIGKANLHLERMWRHRPFRLTQLGDEVALIIVMLLALVALAFMDYIPLISALLGFYVGFFASKELRMEKFGLKRRHLYLKAAIGYLGLAVLLAPISWFRFGFLTNELAYLLYFLAGLWTTLILPLLYEEVFVKREQFIVRG